MSSETLPIRGLLRSTRRTCAQVGTLLASHARCRPFAGVFIDRYSLITMALPIPRSALISLSREPSSPHFETRPDQTCDLVSAVPSDNLLLSSLQALAKQSKIVPPRESGLLRRVAPRNDVALSPPSFRARRFASPRNNQRLDGCCALQNLPNQKKGAPFGAPFASVAANRSRQAGAKRSLRIVHLVFDRVRGVLEADRPRSSSARCRQSMKSSSNTPPALRKARSLSRQSSASRSEPHTVGICFSSSGGRS